MGSIGFREQFLLFYFTFIFFVVYVGGLAGASILTGTTGIGTLPSMNPSDNFLWFLAPVQYFLLFLTINTSILAISLLIFTPLTIVFIFIMVEFIRDLFKV